MHERDLAFDEYTDNLVAVTLAATSTAVTIKQGVPFYIHNTGNATMFIGQTSAKCTTPGLPIYAGQVRGPIVIKRGASFYMRGTLNQTAVIEYGNLAQSDGISPIAAGAALIGKVGIDQTTPGTTNKVTVEGISMTNYDPAALAASGVIKATAGTLYAIGGFNSSASDQYIQFYNLAAVPANGVAPSLLPPMLVPAGGIFSMDLGFHGKVFSTGLCWSNSSTLATKTIGAADVWMTATYK